MKSNPTNDTQVKNEPNSNNNNQQKKLKIVIVGDSGVGKSCLITNYLEN